MKLKYHFSGYATKNDIKCTDGRVIRKGAFKNNDKKKVPLVWQHNDSEPKNILGHVVLEHRNDGVYSYATFNNSDEGQRVRALVEHGDIDGLSIRANRLVERDGNVFDGDIQEVSLVLSRANPGACIDNVVIMHADGSEYETDEAIIYSGALIELAHADRQNDSEFGENPTIREVYDSLTDVQKEAVHILIGAALEEDLDETEEESEEETPEASDTTEPDVKHSDSEDGTLPVHKNVFENNAADAPKVEPVTELTHEQKEMIAMTAQSTGSFKMAVLQHAANFGISNIELLFPDPKPTEMQTMWPSEPWVDGVMNSVNNFPAARFKTAIADLTADEARAKGYVTGSEKKDQVFKLLTRSVTPTTVYKKQKFNRDDMIDITDFNLVGYVKSEMAMKLREELARAILIGDGREAGNPDKINEERLIPIVGDAQLYSHHIQTEVQTVQELIDLVIRAARQRKGGTGRPTLFIGSNLFYDMLLLKDKDGRRIYRDETELKGALRVADIYEMDLLNKHKRKARTQENAGVDETGKTFETLFVLVNMADYRLGANPGGQVTTFEDFDIKMNQQHYLIETRKSGMLVRAKSAVVVERKGA